jgi:hypothetical protein
MLWRLQKKSWFLQRDVVENRGKNQISSFMFEDIGDNRAEGCVLMCARDEGKMSPI